MSIGWVGDIFMAPTVNEDRWNSRQVWRRPHFTTETVLGVSTGRFLLQECAQEILGSSWQFIAN